MRATGWLLAVVIGVCGLSPAYAQSAGDSLPQTQSEYQPQPQFKQKRSREEIEARIRELEQKRRELLEWRKQQDANRMEYRTCLPMELKDVIAKYERLLEHCAVKKSNRCADVMYTLASLYCDKAREEHAANPGGNAPDNSKAIDMYQQLIEVYPMFEKTPNAEKLLDALLQLQNK